MSQDELMNEIGSLDEVDQEILKMLMASMPSHLGWAQGATGDETEAHKLSAHGREVIRGAVASHTKSRGTLPGHVEELIKKMLQPPTVPWTQFLHNIVQRTKQTKKKRGMSRPSKMLSAVRKFAVLHSESSDPRMQALQGVLRVMRRVAVFPGTKLVNKFTIVYVVDTSGSMSAHEMAAGLAQLQHIQKADRDVNICVIYADTHVCKEYWVGTNDEIDPNMTGRGGTDFELVFRHVAENLMRSQEKSPDILIYCTDGYAPPPTTRLPIPVVWLLTPRGAPVMAEAGHITLEMRDYVLGESY